MNKQRSGTLALAGVFTALAVVFLLLTAVIPTVGFAALAGVCGIPVVIERGRAAGLVHFVAVALLALILVPTMEGKGMYIAFFGWYTVFKAWVESRNLPRPAEWAVKIAAFAAAMAAYGAVWVFLLKMPLPQQLWLIPPAAVALCAVFAVYDGGLTGVITVYHSRIRPKISRLFRI